MTASAAGFDVVVVGASIAGCTAARLYALRGARVALVERRRDLDAFKTVCTHFIQPSATPTMERLGLAGAIEARGAVRNPIDFWSPYGGWIRHRQDTPHGYNVTRQTLDPLLRRMTAETPGVELLMGWTATGLLGNGRPAGIGAEDTQRTRREVRARLVVAADGRDSRVARWTRTPGRVRPHNRFFYGRTGAASRARATAHACGSWNPTAPTRFPTRTGCASSSSARTATACPSSARTSSAPTWPTSRRCPTRPTCAPRRVSPS
jgi:2-polyprenyl-6-methoxyphenol hydroxylase-like FAD-dependent oxidoreductase